MFTLCKLWIYPNCNFAILTFCLEQFTAGLNKNRKLF